MTTAEETALPARRPLVLLAGVVALGLFVAAIQLGAKNAALFAIGVCLGVALTHASFGFTGAYRRAIVAGDLSGIAAQALMIAAAILLFAPILAVKGGGALAPVSVSMAFGAFLFGIGMQLGGGCASGTLYAAGGGDVRMMLVLVFFCLGTFLASLGLHWWSALPGIGTVSLGKTLGWEVAVPLQLAALAAIYGGLRLLGGRTTRPLWPGLTWRQLVYGPWPLLLGAGALAALNWLVLLVSGHAWSITWAFSLWTAKIAVLLGWDPASSPFWSGSYQMRALAAPVLADDTSLTNIGILAGALLAAALAGKIAPRLRIPARPLVAAVVGGLAMGYGARLAYGCNIGSFFSGVASSSLHGWVWILAAVPGNLIGVWLRPAFGLAR